MTKPNEVQPSSKDELTFLKDFQRRSMDTVFRRLYLDEHQTQRFLLADEVGLGKTLVARGLITRVIEHLRDTVECIDIVYLCSNSDIARQNVSRLTPRGTASVSLASRITLLPIAEHHPEDKVKIIALTPGTSLNLKGNLGLKLERALLVHLLVKHWSLDFTGACRMFAGNASLQRFKTQARCFAEDHTVDHGLAAGFLEALDRSCKAAKTNGETSIRARVKSLIRAFVEERNQPADVLKERTLIIGELRHVLAKSCINSLQPDLIILDEFQRFKDLLDGTGPAGEMAKQLFEYESAAAKARVLLLSATPYKMYTTAENAAGEDHYDDFIGTIRFLLAGEPGEADRLALLLKDYRREMFRVGNGETDELEATRAAIETILRKVIVRTERLAVTADRNGMLEEKASTGVHVAGADAKSYADVQRLAQIIKHADTIEYWKASPWLLNFMDQYKLGDDIFQIIDSGKQSREFVKAVESAEASLLRWADVEAFRKLDPAHGRLRWLVSHTLDSGLWKLLWLPPELRYYELGEPFRTVAASSPTKALLFSAWRVVPRVVAASLSHEAERRMYVAFEGAEKDLTDAPVRHGDQLKVSRKGTRATGLSTLALLYPSAWLARACDPVSIAARLHDREGRAPTVDEVLAEIEALIALNLARIIPPEASRSTPDESWYWAAPILLDRLVDPKATKEWLESAEVEELWTFKGDHAPADVEEEGESVADQDEDATHETSALGETWKQAMSVAGGNYVPRGVPPKDLLRALALVALAGPATVALRSFIRVIGNVNAESPVARTGAAKVGSSFRTLFNQPDATAIIRASASSAGRAGDYWKQCLEYGASGCLQAVLDEYTHLLIEEAGVYGKPVDEVVQSVSHNMVSAIGIRRGKVGVQHIYSSNRSIKRESKSVRSRFAMRYGEERADETGDKVRADDVRGAFNSPFWPFVLATTSVGQEGLDFHLYCHKVVHWNLPPNPVDLEQREGRVHRFKGHAVRKNVALKHSDVWHDEGVTDPWAASFARAVRERGQNENDLVPFWVYPVPGGASIERHVPMYPLSQDIGRLASLKDSLALYRMVFGQPRQEELLAYLERTVPREQIAELSNRLRISLAP
ncbi:MAG: hypothetical protein H0X34_08165 [Chthoniobacterales bacterium]|nr:hypothetical protein [Chthoniobacterales bacterium]